MGLLLSQGGNTAVYRQYFCPFLALPAGTSHLHVLTTGFQLLFANLFLACFVVIRRFVAFFNSVVVLFCSSVLAKDGDRSHSSTMRGDSTRSSHVGGVDGSDKHRGVKFVFI